MFQLSTRSACNGRRKSEWSKLIQKYAAGLDNPYPEFVASMGRSPQRRGIDKELWEFIEHERPDHNQLMTEYVVMAGIIPREDA